jgi:hypothetical protein
MSDVSSDLDAARERPSNIPALVDAVQRWLREPGVALGPWGQGAPAANATAELRREQLHQASALTPPQVARLWRAYRRAHRREMIWLYAFQVGTDGAVKIGISGNPRQRLAALQKANPVRLRPIACWRGLPIEEKVLHREFAGDQLHGEWFSPTLEVLALAEQYGDDYDSWDG